MSRIKRGVVASKRRKKVLKMAKGFRWTRSTHYKAAKEAVIKAGKYAYRDRRTKKRVMRSLWIKRLNNACRDLGVKYNQLINFQKKNNIELDRKVLSQMAVENPEVFAKYIETVK